MENCIQICIVGVGLAVVYILPIGCLVCLLNVPIGLGYKTDLSNIGRIFFFLSLVIVYDLAVLGTVNHILVAGLYGIVVVQLFVREELVECSLHLCHSHYQNLI